MELDALAKAQPDIEAAGGQIVAISPTLVAFSKALREEKKFSFEILADPGNAVAETYGIRYKLPDDLAALYAKFGIDLPKFNGDDSWALPLPARLIVDTAGVIRYAAINTDYTVRPEPEDTVAALRNL